MAKRGDLLGGSTLGAVGMGWFILLSLMCVVDRLDGSTLGAMRFSFTLGENTGRGGNLVGGLSGARVSGRILSSMWPFLLFCLIFVAKKDCELHPRGGQALSKGNMVRLLLLRKFHLGASGPPTGIVVSMRVLFLSVPRPDFPLHK